MAKALVVYGTERQMFPAGVSAGRWSTPAAATSSQPGISSAAANSLMMKFRLLIRARIPIAVAEQWLVAPNRAVTDPFLVSSSHDLAE